MGHWRLGRPNGNSAAAALLDVRYLRTNATLKTCTHTAASLRTKANSSLQLHGSAGLG
jgi:hypothetical protein